MKNGKLKRVLTICGLVIISSYIIYTIYILIKKPNNICVIKNGYIYEEETAIGYIIREEEVIKNENDIIPIIPEGDKVSKGSSIFKFYNATENDIENKITELEEKIQKNWKIRTKTQKK